MKDKLLNGKYGIIHGSYWMYYGVIASFASVFLLERGYSNRDIGLILALGSIVAVFLQPFIADFADRSQKLSIIGISVLITLGLGVGTAFLFFMGKKSLSLSFLFIGLLGFLTVLQPLFNSLAFKLKHLGFYVNFGLARSVGSLAYSLLCSVLGTLVVHYGTKVLPLTGEITLGILLFSLFLTKKYLNIGDLGKKSSEEGSSESKKIAEERETLEKIKVLKSTENLESIGAFEAVDEINLYDFIRKNKLFVVLNVGIIFVFFSNGVLNSFMMQIVSDVGGNSEDMGRIFAVMAFMEIPTLVFFDRLRKKFSCQGMLKVGAFSFTLKIGLCFFAKSPSLIFLAQGMQPFAFALFLPAMVHFTDEVMKKGEAVKGQALFTITMTLAMVFAGFFGGIILDGWGEKPLLLVSVIANVLGGFVVFLLVDRVARNGQLNK